MLSFEIVAEPSDMIASWVAERVKKLTGFGPCRTFGVVSRDGIVAGVVFHGYDPDAGVIEVSAASLSPRWLSRGVVRLLGEYAFERVGCQLVVARTSARNLRVRMIACRAGFIDHVIPRLRGVAEAESILTLTRETWSAHKLARYVRGQR